MADTLLGEAAADSTEGTAPADTTEAATLLTGAEDQTADTSADGQDTGKEGEAPKEETKPEARAPETYEDFTMPEGMEIDTEIADELKALAKELDLPQDQAQKVADLGAKQAQRFVERQQQQLADASADWLAQTKADTELGGTNMNATLAASKLALDKFGTPEFRQLLNQTQLGNHPEFVRFVARAGKAISEDTFVSGDRNARAQVDFAKAMYPNSNHA